MSIFVHRRPPSLRNVCKHAYTAFSYFHCSIKKKVKGPGGGQGVGGPGGGVGPPTHHPQQQQQQQQHGGGGAGSNKTLPSGGIGMQQQMQPHQSTANHHGNKVVQFSPIVCRKSKKRLYIGNWLIVFGVF